MIVYVLVLWFGIGSNQTSFSVSNIASDAECRRLGAQMKERFGFTTEVRCYAYRAAK